MMKDEGGAMVNYASYLNSMPIIPDVAAKVLGMVESGKEFSFADLERTISADPGLTAKVLKVANSSLFSRPREISLLSTAITMLGVNTIRSLVILVTGSSLFERDAKRPFYRRFWKHALVTAFYAKDLAVQTNQLAQAEESFIGGLLHDVGRVALEASDPQGYEALQMQCETSGEPLTAAEFRLYGTDHKEVGGAILDKWSFPAVYRDVAREHGNENITSPHKRTIILVSVADRLTSGHGSLVPYLPYLGMDLKGLEDWSRDFAVRIEKSPLYNECRGLFRV